MNQIIVLMFCLLFCFFNTSESANRMNQSGNSYFPPIDSDEWETSSIDSLGWNSDKLPALSKLLENNGTRAFLVIKDGKIVIEEYFGKDLLKRGDFDKDKQWYWASAGKTLTAFMVGIAQEEGYLSIDDRTSKYLGKKWTSLRNEKEDLITIRHQLSMTSGLNDNTKDPYGFKPSDLIYKADAGTRWAYHNGPYTLLESVVTSATGVEFDDYFNSRLADKIGMKGKWRWLGNFHLYFSPARSMARFGLLMLNRGNWNGEEVMRDTLFFNRMITPSQTLNNSYGYLWWLNGKESYMLPNTQQVFSGSLTPDAPDDMFSGLGKNGQYLSIIPSLNMVLVRMGDNPDDTEIAAMFQREIWDKLNQIMNKNQ